MFLRTSGAMAALCCVFAISVAHADGGSGVVVYNGGASENFDTLASSGSSSALPAGWYFHAGTLTSYTADDGSLATVGGVYSYGTAAASDRALGSLVVNGLGGSGTVAARIGARVNNQSGSTLSQLQVSYNGEVWQYQATVADKLAFEYSTNATSLTDTAATWTAVAALDFAVPASVVGTGKKDGNLAANRAAVSGTIAGLSVANGADIWVRWNDTNVSGVDNGLAIDDVQFGTPVDTAPAVSATTPADNASGVAIAANLTVNFNEAVTLDPSWYTLSCTSGSHSAAVSGGPTGFTLNPDVDFAYDDVCTLTVLAAAVTDQDGTPDHPAADYAAHFTVASAPVDNPPSVQITTPASNATNVALSANLAITFDEPVTVDAGWYALSCATSGAHTATQSGGGASYTLNPDADFTALEACDLTLFADHIHDQDGTIQQMVSNFLLHFTAGASSTDYYAGVDTSSGPALKAWLHNRIKNHVAFPYSGGTINVYTIVNKADQDPLNPSNILDVYKNNSCTKQASGATCYNKEHTWPNSHGFNDVTTVNSKPYPPYTDTHMLYASDVTYNSDRGNLPYGNCTSGCTELPTLNYNGFGGGSGTHPGNSDWYNGSVYETWGHRKGDVARAVLYMDVRYKGDINSDGQQEPDLQVTDNVALITTAPSGVVQTSGYMGLKTDLIAWSLSDPPDEQERLRNDVVFSYQTNRNPFIDHPEWVECVLKNINCPVASDVIFQNGFE